MQQNLMSSISLVCLMCPIMSLKGAHISHINDCWCYIKIQYKVARPVSTNKASEAAFLLKAVYRKVGMFKYPKVFQCDNGSECRSYVTKLLKKHNVDIRRATEKYKST